jgi:hypothetical protein
MYACMHVYIYVRVCRYMHVYMYAYTLCCSLCLYVCSYACTNISTCHIIKTRLNESQRKSRLAEMSQTDRHTYMGYWNSYGEVTCTHHVARWRKEWYTIVQRGNLETRRVLGLRRGVRSQTRGGGVEGIPSIAEMFRNTDMQRTAPEHQMAAYQRDTSTEEDTPW